MLETKFWNFQVDIFFETKFKKFDFWKINVEKKLKKKNPKNKFGKKTNLEKIFEKKN